MTTPDFFTRADIPGVAEATGEAAAAAETVGLDDMEGWFRFAERAEKLIEKAGNTIMRMREFEANGNRSNVVESEPNDEGRLLQAATVQDPESTGPQPGQISAIKVYQRTLKALTELAKRDPDMKISDVLEQARTFKPVVLAEIEAALLEMVAADPE